MSGFRAGGAGGIGIMTHTTSMSVGDNSCAHHCDLRPGALPRAEKPSHLILGTLAWVSTTIKTILSLGTLGHRGKVT